MNGVVEEGRRDWRACVVGRCVLGERRTVEGEDLQRERSEDGWFAGAQEKSGKGSVSWGWSRREEARERWVLERRGL
jgi:hypothetical protein